MTLQHVSLFTGVGGFDVAAERAGITPAAMCEIDNAAAGVLAHKWPDVPLFRDVKELTGDVLTQLGIRPDRTVLTSGFPCQDLSVAGRQVGLDAGSRSVLFYETARIIDEFRPAWFVLENVPGLLSSQRGRDMGIVLTTLGDIGYGLAYRVLDAQFFGVPQRRRRVFIVGRLGDDGRTPAAVLDLSQDCGGDSREGVAARAQAPRTAGSSIASGGRIVNALTKSLGSGGPCDTHAQAGWLVEVPNA